MKTRSIQRQGDVLLIPAERPKAKTSPIPCEAERIVLAHGEVTGHAHVIESGDVDFVLNVLTLERYIHARKPVVVQHEEHTALQLPAGWYEVRIQREYERGAARNVAD